jgi:putative membrane protein
MSYELIKSLHIIFVVTWFAGLFYIVRLFIYHNEALEKSEAEQKILIPQFLIMQKRLWYGITWPSAILTLVLGPALMLKWYDLGSNPWLFSKLFFVAILLVYHLYCGHIFKQLKNSTKNFSPTFLRFLNEGATVLLITIVLTVVYKSQISVFSILLSTIGSIFGLTLAIFYYKKLRAKQK